MRILGLVAGFLVLIFGILTTWSINYKWILIGALVYSVPLLLQLTKSQTLRLCSVSIGILLVGQSLLSPYVRDKRPKTLRPFLERTWDVRGGVPGVTGIQRVTTDGKGFRVTKAVDYDRRSAYRIFAIGASTTEQVLIDDRSTWTHLLQQGLEEAVPGVEVINAGLSGTRAKQSYATLFKILEYHPDMVIFDLGMNDALYEIVTHFDPLYPFSFDRTFLGRSVKEYWLLLARKAEAPGGKNQPQLFDGSEYDSKRNSLGRATVKRYRPAAVSGSFSHYVGEMVRLCQQNGITCVFVTQPNGYREGASEDFKRGFWMTPPETRYTLDFESLVHVSKLYNDFIVEQAGKPNVLVVDLLENVAPSYDYMYDECHFNLKGARAVAEALREALLPVVAGR
jgi:lysophospholipase L1-like esterase